MYRAVDLLVDLIDLALILIKVIKHELLFTVSHYKSKILVKNNILDEVQILNIDILIVVTSVTLAERCLAHLFIFDWLSEVMDHIVVILHLINDVFDSLLLAQATDSQLLRNLILAVVRNNHA